MTGRAIALEGPSSEAIRTTLADFARARLREGLRVVGVLEERDRQRGSGCAAGILRNIVTGEVFDMSLDRPPEGSCCTLDASGVGAANRSVLQDMTEGCDIVVLSKFGKLEANGEGLFGSFAAALEGKAPLATSVGANHVREWSRLTSRLAHDATPTGEDLEDWWRALRSAQT